MGSYQNRSIPTVTSRMKQRGSGKTEVSMSHTTGGGLGGGIFSEKIST
jgi:hypothetical protein